GLESARESTDELRRPWSTLCAAVAAALVLALLGICASGQVGTFGDIGPGVLLTAGMTFAWLTVAGYIGLAWGRRFLGIPAAEAAADIGAGRRWGGIGDDEYRPGGLVHGRSPSDDVHERIADTADADDAYADDYDTDTAYDDEAYDGALEGADRTVDPPYFDQLFDNPRYVEYEFEDGDGDRDRYPRPVYRRASVELDGELIDDDDEPVHTDPDPEFEFDSESADILDAEVVEGDLPDNPGKGGR
ncbi:MAG: hypothetical protein ACRD0P_34070, partial [Stackebrandtia sp.]